MGQLTLSYSSSNLILGCEQKYWHYKVNQTPIDIDASRDTKAFDIGKAFHDILENCLHEKPSDIMSLLLDAKETYNLEEDEQALIHGMVLKYFRETKQDGLFAVHCELQISDEILLGFIDLIASDENGFWWIIDLKTAKTVFPTKIKTLPMDTQLNLYASFAKKIAPHLNLDPEKFMGCRYRVTTKPSLKKKKTESYPEYVLRIADKAKFHDFVIPIESMNPEEVYARHKDLHAIAKKIHDGKKDPRKNFNYCESYFRPCEYWSQCHGKCFSEVEVIDASQS